MQSAGAHGRTAADRDGRRMSRTSSTAATPTDADNRGKRPATSPDVRPAGAGPLGGVKHQRPDLPQARVVRVADHVRYPGPRYRRQGPGSGEALRDDHIVPALEAARKEDERLEIELGGTEFGYPVSFLEETLGGLVRQSGAEAVRKHITLKDEDGQSIELAQDLLNDALANAEGTTRPGKGNQDGLPPWPIVEPGTKGTIRVRALVVLDAIGGGGKSADDEFGEVLEHYAEIHGLWLDARRAETFNPHGGAVDGCDLVIFDWGGASIGNDMMLHQMRWLVQWAEDHPSALIVIRSMAWSALEGEIEAEQLPRLPNIVLDDGDLTIPSWWLAGREGS